MQSKIKDLEDHLNYLEAGKQECLKLIALLENKIQGFKKINKEIRKTIAKAQQRAIEITFLTYHTITHFKNTNLHLFFFVFNICQQ